MPAKVKSLQYVASGTIPDMLATRRMTRHAMPLISFVLLFACVSRLAEAQQRNSRFVIDFGVTCHDSPDLSSRTGHAVPILGGHLVGRKAETDGTSWYFFANEVSTQNPSCWVYGPSTIETNPNDSLPSWLAMLDHQLGRTDVRFDQYVQLDNLLSDPDRRQIYGDQNLAGSGLLRFKMLQLLELAISGREGDGIVVDADPLKKAWMLAHLALVDYFSPGGQWTVRAKPYWDLFERNRLAPWAEEVAWVASQHQRGTDDCDLDCVFRAQIIEGTLKYWSRFPRGAYIAEALKAPLDLMKYAANAVCSVRRSGGPVQPEDMPVSYSVAEEIRTSLVKVTHTGRLELLKYLDETEGNCSK
jgi:hypothetical protein